MQRGTLAPKSSVVTLTRMPSRGRRLSLTGPRLARWAGTDMCSRTNTSWVGSSPSGGGSAQGPEEPE